jgi:hypothetical protein
VQTIGIALAMDGPRQRHADAQIKNQEDQTSADFTRLLALSFLGGSAWIRGAGHCPSQKATSFCQINVMGIRPMK